MYQLNPSHNLKDGAPSQANDKKRKAETFTPLKGNFGATNKVSCPTTKKGCTHFLNTVDLDMNKIASQVFGLLLENLKENAELPPASDVVWLASKVLIDLATCVGEDSSRGCLFQQTSLPHRALL